MIMLAKADGKGVTCCYSVEREESLMRKSRSSCKIHTTITAKTGPGGNLRTEHVCRVPYVVSGGLGSACNKAENERTQAGAYQLISLFT